MNTFILFFKKYKIQIAVLALSLYGLWLRGVRLYNRHLGGDEKLQFFYIDGPFKAFWLPHYTYGDHTSFPGEYLLTYPFVQWFGPDKWGLAIPHILMTILGFYFLYKICQRYYTSLWSYIAAFLLVAQNLNLIFHSFEFRPYAILPTLAIGSLYFADCIVVDGEKISRMKKFWIGAYFVTVTFAHVYGILMVVLPLTFILLANRKEGYQKWIFGKGVQFFKIILYISVPLWLWYASSNNFGFKAIDQDIIKPQALEHTFEYIPNPTRNFVGFLKGIFGNLLGYKPLYFLGAGVILSFCLKHDDRFKQIAFLLFLILLPLQLILITDLFSHYWFVQRQFVWLMPLFAFLVGWCWDSSLRVLLKR